MRRMTTHIQTALLRAITPDTPSARQDRQKPMTIVEQIHSEDWASATFVGATHRFDLRLEGSAADVEAAAAGIAGRMRDEDITIPGHIVADAEVEIGETHCMADNIVSKNLTVNVLTIMD